MTGLIPLLKKEIMEQIRTHKLLIVAAIFLVFGITTPLMLKYLPQILELAGGAGMDIAIPEPTAAQSLAEFSGTMSQIGILVVVLLAMGTVANEIKRGTAILTLSKPVSRAAFINAKLIAVSLNFTLSLVISSLICFGYTVWLIEKTDIAGFTGQLLLLILFFIFSLAVTVFFSCRFNSSLAAGGIAIAVIAGQGALSAIPTIGDYFPGKLLSWGNQLVAGSSDSYWWALAITLVVTTTCIYGAQLVLKNRDL